MERKYMNDNLNVFDDTKIYIVCPSNNKTGGTELLHQLCKVLYDNDINVLMCYYLEGEKASREMPMPEAFKKYIDNYGFIEDIEDNSHNIVVFPEVCIGKHRKLKKIQKVVWWLSVDNYYAMIGKFTRLKKYGFLSFCKHLLINDYINKDDIHKFDLHLYQSKFAQEFLLQNKVDKNKTAYLSDYINEDYLVPFSPHNREDIVIYNPKKGIEFTEKIIGSCKDVKFVPLVNMTNEQVAHRLRTAKLYIDFGNHPGKDRIPREAAISGCCVITNRRGSAQYFEDVRIPDDYKFVDSEDNLNEIANAIKRCIRNYDNCIGDFETYRQMIANEKTIFEKDAADIFKVRSPLKVIMVP